jgi:SAM-dependent MidA family methyltransferase
MTHLRDALVAQIRQTGPITVAEYMNISLLHPVLGYYTTRDPFGVAGDFTTAPEISQMFGELIGLSLAQSWLDQGAPNPFTLAEIGPGRGTMMADIIRATKGVPGFLQAMDVWLIEASDTLRAQQLMRVPTAQWANSVDELPTDQPVFLVANEFFDALPIRQFQRAEKGWSERLVGIDATTNHLSLGLGKPQMQPALIHREADTKTGDVVELCETAIAITASLAQRIARQGGAALIIDYGDWRSLGDTFQALENHAPADPFANPGQADLTAHLDFEALAIAAGTVGATASKVETQGVFLEQLGITARAQTLAAALDGDALVEHVAAHRRLTHPDEMGKLFKVMAITPPNIAPPAGIMP